MFTRRARSGQDVVTTPNEPMAGSSGSRRLLARALQSGTNEPIGGCRALSHLRSEELFQAEQIVSARVMFVGRCAIARDMPVRGNDRRVVAPRLCL